MRTISFIAVVSLGVMRTGVQDAGLRTTIDATGDTIIARVAGAVPQGALRHLVAEMRIAPALDDTSLFTNVAEFDVDQRGSLWVFDVPSRSILLFDSTGKLVRRVGRGGAGPGEFSDNGGMVILPDSRLAQWAPRNARISFFSPNGAYLTSWTLSGGFGSTNNLVTDHSGQLYTRRPRYARGAVANGRDVGVLVRYLDGGGFGDTLIPPTYDLPTYIVNLSQGNQRMFVSVPHTPRSHWAWHPDGHFVVGDGSKYHIVIGRRNAKPIRIERQAPSVPIPEDQWKAMEARARMTIPHVKAPLEDLFVSRDGRIWAQVATPSRHVVWEVYSKTGTFLGRVEFPEHARITQADGDRVWVADSDKDGLPVVARMRIVPPLPR